jgi:p-aminobenzoyl-glutamate transporter AbgT
MEKTKKLCYYYYTMLSIYIRSLDAILKSIIKRQIPFLIGGTITGSIMAYYYGFLFTIIVNSIMWYVISYLVSKYYYKSKDINDQKYLIQYALNRIKKKMIFRKSELSYYYHFQLSICAHLFQLI